MPIAEQLADRREPGLGILADKRLAQLPGVAVPEVAGVGRIVDRRIEVDHRLRRENAEARRNHRRGSRCCGEQQWRARLECAKLRGSGIDQGGRAESCRCRRKAEAPAVRLIDRVPFDRRGAAVAAGADDLLGKRKIDTADAAVAPRVVDLADAVSGSPASAEHIAWTSERTFGSYLRMPSSIGHSAGASAFASALWTRDLHHLGRETVGIDAGDEHPRRIGLAESKQQPGTLGRPSRSD